MQVLQEYYVTVTQKLDPGLPHAAAQADIRLLQAWQPVSTDAALLETGWDLQQRHQLSFWNAMIVAAAVRVAATYLLSEDLQDGEVFDGTRVMNPFRHAPSSL